MSLPTWVLPLLVTGLILAQLPPSPPGRGPAPPVGPGPRSPGGSPPVRRKLTEVRPASQTEEKLLVLARSYLERSDHVEIKNRFASDRDLVAADALVNAAEHQQHVLQAAGPGPPSRDEIARHLERVYFRLEQADYFANQSADPNAKRIAEFARQYYQSALRAQDRSESRRADECAKSADELMRALESLAQAAVSPPPPALGSAPTGPPPPVPPKPPGAL
jgi:hypothetical protein